MGKRRKLPDTFEKNARTKQKTIEFAPIIKSTSNVFEKPMGTQQTQVLTMESVRIDFPLKPYPAQLQMMSKIIHALNNSENALLESPTGSGKSLALLCAALAWKENEKKKSKKTTREAPKDAPVDMEGTFNDWVHQFKYEETSTLTPQAYHDMQCDEQQQPQESNNDPTNYVRTRIFVGSRTHRQLSQLISELKRNTAYSPRITVLGSREQLCNHPIVSKSSNKSEDCITLLDKSECSYFHNTKKLVSNSSLKTTHRVWDIEDMVSLGKQVKGCAYYASRKLYETAEVVFCPYNYILDPVIRKLLDINLTGSIVILDEAHNMEDAARSAGSFAIDDKTLSIVKIELASIIKGGFEVEAHKVIENLFDNLWDFITSEKNIYTIFERERSVIIWAGLEIVDKLKELGIESDMFEEYFLLAYKTVSAHADMIRKEKEKRSIDLPETEGNDSQVKIHKRECLSNNSLSVVQTIFMVFGFLFRKDRSYTNDYRMVLMSRLDPDNQSTQKKRSIVDPDWNFKLEFWCMNPGVIFQDMCASTKSVILTSGTLSPMDTFASELEISFQGKLEANHVIDPSQVWVSCIPVGPSGTNLKGVYTVVEGTPYQDDVGEALYTISTKVPFGILCFLPSYKLLNTLMARWKKTGLLERLKKIKTVFQEPKGSDKKRFEREIVRYYTTINDTQIVNGKKNGAIFFAVYRGKVSEGIDFPNNYCRAVVALGIPYPGVRDIEVKLKRQYNDIRRDRMKENVLSGENWYSIQAYRAINQALGRCIRHKDDWGAIVLLESRFTEYEKRKGLSKWLRDRVEVRQDFTEGMGELEKFVQNRMELDKEAQEKEKLAKAKLKEEAMKKEESTYNISDAYIPPDGHQQIPLQMPVAYTVNPGCPYYFPYQGNTTMDQQAFIPYSQISGSSHSLSYMGNVGALPAISQYRPYHNPLIGNATPSQTTIPPAHTPVQYFPILVNKQVPGEHSFIQERIDPPPTLDALLQTSVESIIKSTMSSISKSEANLSQCDSNYRQFKKHQSYSVASSQPMIEETSPFSYPVYRAKTEPVLPLSVATNIVESPYFVKSPVREAPKPAQTEVSKPSHVQEPILAEEPPKPAYAEEVSKPVCAEKVLEHNHLETSASSAPTKKDILPKETTDLYPEHSNVDSFSIAGIPSEQFQRPEPNQDRQSTDGSPTVLIQGEGSFEDLDAAFEDDFDFSVSDVCIEESQTMANISPRDFRPGAVERVYCNKCQTVLMTGDQSHLVISSQSVWDCGTQLSTAQGPMWEVQYPERWISLLCIDPAKMPNETQVYMNKKDQLFYQKMHCGCDEWVGIFVCGAMKPEQEAQIGKVFLWHKAVLTSEEQELKTETMKNESDNEDLWGDLLTSEVDALAKAV